MAMSNIAALVAACAPLVHPTTAQALVKVESAFNPNAIGVVGGTLQRQPRSRQEALATAALLRSRGFDFSVGLGQINVRNLARLDLNLQSAFEPCTNLHALQTLLVDCFDRASLRSTAPQRALRQALSCYYSGNFVTGFKAGYVDRVIHALAPSTARSPHPLRPKETP